MQLASLAPTQNDLYSDTVWFHVIRPVVFSFRSSFHPNDPIKNATTTTANC